MKWGSISAHKLESERSKILLCPFLCSPRPSAVTLESPTLENIPPVPGNRAKVAQSHDARRAFPATFSVFKKMQTERAIVLPVSISLQSKDISSYFRIPGPPQYPASSGKSSQSCSKARCAEDGLAYSFSPKNSKVNVQKLFLSQFN